MALDNLPNPNWSVVYGETPAASKWSELGENDDALATAAGWDAGIVTAEHMDYPNIIRDDDDTSNSAIAVDTAKLTISLTPGLWLVTYKYTAGIAFNSSSNGRATSEFGNNPGTTTHPSMKNKFAIGVTTGGASNTAAHTFEVTDFVNVPSSDDYSVWFTDISATATSRCDSEAAMLAAMQITQETS